MSEQMKNADPVVTALNLEREIAASLQIPADDKARTEVRNKMEEWLKILDNRKASKLYQEITGEVDPARAKVELLSAISARFPRVAKELGFDESLVAQYQQTEELNNLAA